MSGWQRPEVAFDPNHAPMANLPMIRFSRHDIESARYRVKRKKRTAEKNSRTGKSDPQGAADKQCPKPGKIKQMSRFPGLRCSDVSVRTGPRTRNGVRHRRIRFNSC